MSEKETKVINIQLIGNKDKEFTKQIGKHLGIFKDNLKKTNFPYNLEFIMTSDTLQLYDVKYLIEEIYKLYKRENKLLDAKKKQIQKMQSEKNE